MFGLLLRSELLQGSAARTWNCVLNIANFFRYKFTNFRQPVMPRSRRRHHSRSRSRSRSHSHDRDREPKRRRVESPDSSHHRRSVSVDSDTSPKKIVNPVPDSEEISTVESTTAEAVELKESTKDLNKTADAVETEESSSNATADADVVELNDSNEESVKDLNATVESGKDLNATVESVKDLNTTLESVDLNSTAETTNKILSTTLESEKTPKKIMSPAQKRRHEQRMKLKQEKEEQRLKEKKEKEEQRRREKEEREEQKRKEREEKQKEKEEKEEQKRKEREEKEEQKRKEREEKELIKKKEKEEKEEQKRKEREEKELKKLQEIDEKNREKKKKEELMQKEKAAFVNFFVPRKSSGPTELKKPEDEKKSYAFMPFEIKADMRVAPTLRITLEDAQKESLTDKLTNQTDTLLYLDEIKSGKKLGKSSRTWPVQDEDEVMLVEESDIGEIVDEEKPKIEKMRAKLLKFHENRRPAYFGTWRKKSKTINPRKPLALDKELFDYEVDSDDDWEEEEPGESLHGSDDEEKDNDPDDYEVDNDFFVPHGYLSDEEGEAEESQEVSPETQKEKLKLLQEEFDEEMKSKTERIKPRLIGCIWENKLIPKIQDALSKFLEDRMMIITGTITIQKRDLINSSYKTKHLSSNRKLLSNEFIPEFLNLIHGNTNNQNFLINEFITYLATKELDKTVSKSALSSQLKQFAKWKRCPDEGSMFNKMCWYVDEEVRNQFNVTIELPNKWTYTANNTEENPSAKRKLIV